MSTLVGNTIFCNCGEPYTLAQFRELPRPYEQLMTDGEKPERLECRQCVKCRTHFGLWTDLEGNIYREESDHADD